MAEKMSLYQKLSHIQNELKAPKNQYNSFGKYKYRNCEDILEALKPLCNKYETTLIIRDEIQVIGMRTYVMAKSTLHDWDSDLKISATAYARESETKKGMDDSQVTGATSSYARKYSLNGLFNIDDTKDADSDEVTSKTEKELEELIIKYTELRVEMNKLSIDFRNEFNEWILGKAKVKTQDMTELTAEELKQLNTVYRALIKGKKDKEIEENNKKEVAEAGGF